MPPQASSPSSERRTPRTSKACEPCRLRRIKCTGPPPCEQCRAGEIVGSCTVRSKARPRRAPSSALLRLQEREAVATMMPVSATQISAPARGAPVPAPAPAPVMMSALTSPNGTSSATARVDMNTRTTLASSIAESLNPLEAIEAQLASWCDQFGVPLSSLVFKAEKRLEDLPYPPLPPEPLRSEREDELMLTFLDAAGDSVRGDGPEDKTLLSSLYGRYRALPRSLADDQRAVVYAALCIIRWDQVRRTMKEDSGLSALSDHRDDITYYHMACESLTEWGRPSMNGVWCMFYLAHYCTGMGSPTETKNLVRQWMWHITELGLHRTDTAALYRPHEHVQPLFSAFVYTDTFCAHLTDLKPTLPFGSFDVDPTPPPRMLQEALTQSSFFTAKYLADLSDSTLDTTSPEYVTASEAAWMPVMRELRHQKTDGLPRMHVVRSDWAQMRYNLLVGLRCLLYFPHTQDPQLAPQAYATIARAVEQILYTYEHLISIRQLEPSWPQVRRLMCAGQLLILCCQAGEFHKREASRLFQLVIDLLLKHQTMWPVAADLIAGFTVAAQVFDVIVGPELTCIPFDPQSCGSTGDPAPLSEFPYDLGFDFDISSFAFVP